MKPASPGVGFIVRALILFILLAKVNSLNVVRKRLKGGSKDHLAAVRELDVKYDQEKACDICSVIAHPHPAGFSSGQSGSENGYVKFMGSVLRSAGVCTARFDFRSSGFLSQDGDIKDYVEVMHRVKRELGCMRGFINAGYSYGSAIAHGALSIAHNDLNILGYIGLAPPWSVTILGDHYETQWTMSKDIHIPRIIIFGDEDSWCSKKKRDHYAKVFVSPSPQFISLPGGTHWKPATKATTHHLRTAIETGVKTVLTA